MNWKNALWYHPGNDPVPVRWVFVGYRDEKHKLADTVGTIVLGILSLLLLWALLAAHRRERKTIRKQVRLS